MQVNDTAAEITVAEGEPAEIRVLFAGASIEAKITLFELPGGTPGVGVYPTAASGAVLRWDHGPAADPRVVYWRAPHCGDDQCGSPCGHKRKGAAR
jgi:hypothetical protein